MLENKFAHFEIDVQLQMLECGRALPDPCIRLGLDVIQEQDEVGAENKTHWLCSTEHRAEQIDIVVALRAKRETRDEGRVRWYRSLTEPSNSIECFHLALRRRWQADRDQQCSISHVRCRS